MLSVVFYACHDTNSFEQVRQIRTGMTITQVEGYMGKPTKYSYVNDSTEWRYYTYDEAGSGVDKQIQVTYQNERVMGIKNY